MLFISGIAISFFLSALLLFKKNKSTSDKILLTWFVFIGIHQLFFYSYFTNYIYEYPELLGVNFPLPLIHGPFLYLYAASLVDRLSKNKLINLLHFLPAILCYCYLMSYFILPTERRVWIMEHQGVGYETFMNVNYLAIIISGVSYVAATLILLKKHQRTIRDNFSDIEKINLKWLQYLTYGIGIIWLVVIFGTDKQTFITIVFFVMIIGFFGIKQTPIFTTHHPYQDLPNPKISDPDPTAPEPEKISAEEVQKRYETSGLSQSKKMEIAEELKKRVEEEKLFLDAELSLDMLADHLQIHPNYLSQYINEELSLTFYDYINAKRVEEFKRISHLPEKQHFSLLGLALECGFNSKSSFNRNFKKFVGLTPSEYLNSVKA